MKTTGSPADVDRAEQIKWFDAMDAYGVIARLGDAQEWLRALRKIRHPDAQWIASLFPDTGEVTAVHLHSLLREHTGDPRALHMLWALDVPGGNALLERAAEMGYAPAQAQLSTRSAKGNVSHKWASRAAAQGDRAGLHHLGDCFQRGWGCEKDTDKATELFRLAAELGSPAGQHSYGKAAYDALDWRRYVWLGRSASSGFDFWFRIAAVGMLPDFEIGKRGRILHTVAPVIRKHLDCEKQELFHRRIAMPEWEQLLRIVALHDAMLGRARPAIDCWSVVGRRVGVAKDVRVMIAKMVWDDAWRWNR